jgi:hypothetical protein
MAGDAIDPIVPERHYDAYAFYLTRGKRKDLAAVSLKSVDIDAEVILPGRRLTKFCGSRQHRFAK